MHILSWNVNGIRAVLKKDAWNKITALAPDVICLQEIKTKPDQLTEAQSDFHAGYQIIWNPAERPGYSGVATLVKETPFDVIRGFGYERYDVEGRVIQSYFKNFILFNIYFPNGQRDQGRLDYKLSFYSDLLAYCQSLMAAGQHVILCGDFNTAHSEIDLKNPKSNQTTSGFLPEERVWVDRYLDSGFIDIYRHLYPEKIQYTWWTYITNARQRNVGWRLDYFLISEGLLPLIEDTIIHDDILGSDHCPVSLKIKVN